MDANIYIYGAIGQGGVTSSSIKDQLAALGQQIAEKMDSLYDKDNTIYKQINMNADQFNKNVAMYKSINTQIKNELEIQSPSNIEGMANLNMNDINGMLTDSDLRVLQENYGYIFWSILAVGLLTITMNTLKR
jgi:hypothetical protein